MHVGTLKVTLKAEDVEQFTAAAKRLRNGLREADLAVDEIAKSIGVSLSPVDGLNSNYLPAKDSESPPQLAAVDGQ